MSEPVLWAAEELSLAIGRQTLYDNAEFFINAGERVGLIGRNGSGKSTLLRLITGEELPGSGNLTRDAQIAIRSAPATNFPAAKNAGSRWRGRSSPNPICCCWTNRPTISTSRRWSGLKSSSPNTAAAVFS